MSALFACEGGQGFGVDGFVEEDEAGRGQDAVALGVDVSHQHIVQTFGYAGASLTGGGQSHGHDWT